MITQQFRPRTFADVAGNEVSIRVLKSIIKNPQKAPKTIILHGEYGTGKTTCARILARALNCKHKTKDGDACGECEFCKSNIESSIFYEEYDSSTVGNVDTIKALKETFYFDETLGYKVVVLDEGHLMSQTAQSALLKILETDMSGIFIVICTTHLDRLLNTIRSRSLKLEFDLVKDNDIILNLQKVASELNLVIPDNILKQISNKSMGHLRDAHMFLDLYTLLEQEDFNNIIQSAKDNYYKLIIAALKGDMNIVTQIIDKLLSFPLTQLKSDYESTVLEIIKCGMRVEETDSQYLNLILKVFRNNIFSLVNKLNNTDIYRMFNTNKQFQAAMFILVKDIMQLKRG